MPEGPEVYIISRYIHERCIGLEITDIQLHPDSKFKDVSSYHGAIGTIITNVAHKGKKIIFELENGGYLLSGLGMEGRWEVSSTFPESQRHLSVSITLEDPALEDPRYLTFWDMRHFGDLSFCSDLESLESRLASVGPSWIQSPMFPGVVTLKAFYNKLQNRRIGNKKIMCFLMEQKYFSGVGNYIRAEALYLSKINPHRCIKDITVGDAARLHEAILYVMDEAVDQSGHSIRTYVAPGHGAGIGYVPIIYGREKTADTGNIVVTEMDPSGRTIHWDPLVQI